VKFAEDGKNEAADDTITMGFVGQLRKNSPTCTKYSQLFMSETKKTIAKYPDS
jgi:hypothetical protein